MSEPFKDVGDSVRAKLHGAMVEISKAESTLNMEPRPIPIEEQEGEYLSHTDFWVKHSMEHLKAAFEHIESALEKIE